jgi:hypothetical protein
MLDLLFLDFDGVLHPMHEHRPTPIEDCFCHLPLFESVLRESSGTRIVISSTWRLKFDLDQLRSHFSNDIAARIFDVTPLYPLDAPPLVTQREWEIMQWLRMNAQADVRWAALDDAVYEFREFRPHVIGCRSWEGFTSSVALELLERLR